MPGVQQPRGHLCRRRVLHAAAGASGDEVLLFNPRKGTIVMNVNVTNVRVFEAKKATPGPQPLLIGLVGPPGGGKTVSALRLASGMRRVRPGPVVLIDTACQRSRKCAEDFDFMRVDFDPPFRSSDFVKCVRDQLKLKPAAIIIDTMSDEHAGEGGYLDWHDELVPTSGGN